MPKTKLGIWAGGLSFVFIVLFVALIYGMNVARWQPGTPLSVTVGTSAAIAGVAAFVTGMVSLKKLKDRSIIVRLAVIIRSIVILMIIMGVVMAIAWRSTH